MWGYVQFTATEAGRAKEYCDEDQDAEVKWALRKIYYRQRKLYSEQGKWAERWEDLNLTGDRQLKVKDFGYPPLIMATDSLFEAIYIGKDGQKWHIRQDGLIWKTSSEQK